ncbi:hypothetical protein SSPO_005990 [Streptomyces antimycoticus]|uniref:Uncharacterized protein n=1 Tax=Streptomyces antimycoticus TaxID=68175 RepID=A0A499UL73_9ACTN|nr:hypothetical protein SSPO_005990 [Streptomyces antimycoticus]
MAYEYRHSCDCRSLEGLYRSGHGSFHAFQRLRGPAYRTQEPLSGSTLSSDSAWRFHYAGQDALGDEVGGPGVVAADGQDDQAGVLVEAALLELRAFAAPARVEDSRYGSRSRR